MRTVSFKTLCFFVCITISCSTILHAQKTSRPNIIVILADDMGYSDIGCFGSEIETPNIDQLASNGLRMSQFYNTARCCPTRASLLTGLYPHMAGMGHMTGNPTKEPGYAGDLNDKCVSIAQVLKPAGYSTYATGKWHVANNTKDNGPKHNWPLQRGFDKYYGIIPGAADYFDPKGLKNGNDPVKPGDNFYLTDALSDTAASYIQQHKDNKNLNPFFMYVAYNAPHWPLHAKEKDIKKYADKYLAGWDKLREQRYSKQQKTGLLDASAKLNPRDAEVPAWDDISKSEKLIWAKRMAVYAAQVDCLDQGVGRIVQALKKNNLFDNTLIIFLSDNGGCAEFISRDNKTINALGSGDSYESYRINWANASNTPFRLYKHWVHEGGISAPCVVSWPAMLANKGSVVNTPAHLIDLLPTFVNISAAKYPATFNGHDIAPLSGKSLLSIFKGEKNLPERPIYWEHEANRAVRFGKWKLVSKGTKIKPYAGSWELYNITADRSETNDLSKSQPAKVKELEAMWNNWATNNQVFPLNGLNNAERERAAGKNGDVE